MCGIFCCISHTSQLHQCNENHQLSKLLINRGPNAKGTTKWDNAVFEGFVLWHQGKDMCKQPLESDTHILLYNGDMYNENNVHSPEISDSKIIFEQLSSTNTDEALINYIKVIEGPYSIIFYNKLKRVLYFLRDSLGRNSLLIENNSDHLRLLSISHKNDKHEETLELPPLGVYKFNNDDSQTFSLFPWRPLDSDSLQILNILERCCNIKVNVSHHIDEPWADRKLSGGKYEYNFYDVSQTFSNTSELYDYFLEYNDIFNAIHNFSILLENSVKKRVQYTTKYCASCLESQPATCNHSKVAILFSGGIDCSILAVLSNKFIPKTDSIDLVNVAFENAATNTCWNVPDRISAKCSLEDLKQLCPERQWNFIEVNINKVQLYENLNNHIKHLIFPLQTVLDESIGCAFWFASRAIGLKEEQPWTSSARVVILGSGADELFGGYVRHKNAYVRCNGTEAEKQQNLLNELEKDWSRIPSRNLARDDRVISDNGKTPRAPYIEENVVNFVRSLPPNQRCCFSLEDGIGDKLFLRLYGYYLGLKSSAFLKKRAIQFGSRIANKKQNAADRSLYL